MQHAECGVTVLVENGELDRRVFEGADACSPAVVVTGACVSFGLFERDRQVFDVFDLGTVDGQDGVETEFYFSGHGVSFASCVVKLLDGVPPEFGELGSVCVEGRFHERAFGVSPGFACAASLVLFVDQPAGSVGLGGGSQLDASELAGPDRSNRAVLADSETMAFELATFLGDAAELVKMPELPGDFVDRADDDAGCFAIDFVAERAAQSAGWRTGGSTGPRRVLAFADRAIRGLANRSAGVTERVERRSISLLLDAVGVEANSRPNVDHLL